MQHNNLIKVFHYAVFSLTVKLFSDVLHFSLLLVMVLVVQMDIVIIPQMAMAVKAMTAMLNAAIVHQADILIVIAIEVLLYHQVAFHLLPQST